VIARVRLHKPNHAQLTLYKYHKKQDGH
jgi:hypothetical protein